MDETILPLEFISWKRYNSHYRKYKFHRDFDCKFNLPAAITIFDLYGNVVREDYWFYGQQFFPNIMEIPKSITVKEAFSN